MCSKLAGSSTTLPPLYHLKDAQRALNTSIEIERLQGGYPGAFTDLMDTLRIEVHKIIRTHILTNNNTFS